MSIVNVEPETSHHSGSSGPRASACKGIPGYVSCRTCQTGCPTVRSILAAPAATIAPCCPTLRPRHSAKENALLNLQMALEDNVTPTHGTSRSTCGLRLSTAPGNKNNYDASGAASYVKDGSGGWREVEPAHPFDTATGTVTNTTAAATLLRSILRNRIDWAKNLRNALHGYCNTGPRRATRWSSWSTRATRC